MYKNLDIANIKKKWLTCDKTSDRWSNMEKLLSDLSWSAEKINGEITTPYQIGVAKAHISALDDNGQVLVIEDDIAQNQEIPPELSIPEDADAIYLGSSQFGVIKGKTTLGGVIAGDYDNYYNKIFNMLGLHSIIYITERFKATVKETLQKYIDNPSKINVDYGCDNPIAMIQYKYNVYSIKVPWFYQNDGHSEQATLTPITPILC